MDNQPASKHPDPAQYETDVLAAVRSGLIAQLHGPWHVRPQRGEPSQGVGRSPFPFDLRGVELTGWYPDTGIVIRLRHRPSGQEVVKGFDLWLMADGGTQHPETAATIIIANALEP
jgi:hypothetical protein